MLILLRGLLASFVLFGGSRRQMIIHHPVAQMVVGQHPFSTLVNTHKSFQIDKVGFDPPRYIPPTQDLHVTLLWQHPPRLALQQDEDPIGVPNRRQTMSHCDAGHLNRWVRLSCKKPSTPSSVEQVIFSNSHCFSFKFSS